MVAHSISGSLVPINNCLEKKSYSFIYKDDSWFIVLNENGNSQEWEEINLGKDNFLDLVAGKKREVKLCLHNREFEGASQIHLLQNCFKPKGGAYYGKAKNQSHKIWTCNLMLVVFGDFPDLVFFKKETN